MLTNPDWIQLIAPPGNRTLNPKPHLTEWMCEMFSQTMWMHTQRHIRRVITLPLPEPDCSPAGPAADAPRTPQAPVSIHMLGQVTLTDTLSSSTPLRHKHRTMAGRSTKAVRDRGDDTSRTHLVRSTLGSFKRSVQFGLTELLPLCQTPETCTHKVLKPRGMLDQNQSEPCRWIL